MSDHWCHSSCFAQPGLSFEMWFQGKRKCQTKPILFLVKSAWSKLEKKTSRKELKKTRTF